MTPSAPNDPFSRRERQIMQILHRAGEASAAEVRAAMPDPPSYSAVRATLRILENEGHVQHREDGPRYVFAPVESHARASRSAMRRLVDTFFKGSAEQALSALLESQASKLSQAEFKRLEKLVRSARKQGR